MDEVHRAHLQALLQGGLVRVAGEEDDGDGLGAQVALERLQHREAVAAGQEAIQEDEVRPVLPGQLHALL